MLYLPNLKLLHQANVSFYFLILQNVNNTMQKKLDSENSQQYRMQIKLLFSTDVIEDDRNKVRKLFHMIEESPKLKEMLVNEV